MTKYIKDQNGKVEKKDFTVDKIYCKRAKKIVRK